MKGHPYVDRQDICLIGLGSCLSELTHLSPYKRVGHLQEGYFLDLPFLRWLLTWDCLFVLSQVSFVSLRTHCVDQYSLKLLEICLPLPATALAVVELKAFSTMPSDTTL